MRKKLLLTLLMCIGALLCPFLIPAAHSQTVEDTFGVVSEEVRNDAKLSALGVLYNAGSVVILKRDSSGVVSKEVRDGAKLSASGVIYNAGSVVILKRAPLGTAPTAGVIKTVGKQL